MKEILIAFLIGCFVGLLTHARKYRTIKKPKNHKNSFYPGFLIDLAFGGIAAVVAIIVAKPSGIERIILTAIISGYMGEGYIAKMDLAKANKIKELDAKVEEKLTSDIPTPEQLAEEEK